MLEHDKDILECNFVAYPLHMADNENKDTHVTEDKEKNVSEDKADEVTTEAKDISRDKNVTKDETDDKDQDDGKQADDDEVVVDFNMKKVQYKSKPYESDVDTGKGTCLNCAKLEKEHKRILKDTLNTSELVITQLEQHNTELEEKVKRLTEKKNNAEERYLQIKQRSDEITAKMADVFDAKVELENVNDKFSNTKLAKRFESMYDNKWSSLAEWLLDNNDGLEEVNMIKHLTSLMKTAYEKCNDISEKAIRAFLDLEDDDPIPTSREDPSLYKVKRKYGKTEKRRNGIKKSVWGDLLKETSINELLTEEQTEKHEEGKSKLEEFFNEYADVCWLITISQPKIILNFNVIGELYEGNVRDRFRNYACQDTVKDMTKVTNSIIEVVWPSVELEDGSGIHTKGDVIVVAEGENEEEMDDIESGEAGKCDHEPTVGDTSNKKSVKKEENQKRSNSKKGPNEEDKCMERVSENVTKEKAKTDERKTKGNKQKGTSKKGPNNEDKGIDGISEKMTKEKGTTKERRDERGSYQDGTSEEGTSECEEDKSE